MRAWLMVQPLVSNLESVAFKTQLHETSQLYISIDTVPFGGMVVAAKAIRLSGYQRGP